MFNTDKPILKSEEDLLGRSAFSKQLAKAILAYTSTDNFTIGLCGKWGSGKTSILNMVEENIHILTKDNEKSTIPIIVHFNPWYYTDRSQITSQFFNEILVALNTSPNHENLKIVGEALENYSSIFDFAGMIPVIGPYLKPLASLIKGMGADFKEVADAKKSLDRQKEEVCKAMREQAQKIIVIIDDIDRLNNEQIRLIFQLVNSLAGFPNMIYLLSFDREVVSRALSVEQNCNGEEYLEKIIQLHFDIPETQTSLVQKVLFDRLNLLYEEIAPSHFDEKYWSQVYTHCIEPFIKGIRDINRVLNVYRFQYSLMHNEVNCIDLLVLATFQVCVPGIYRWIYNNEYRITGLSTGKQPTSEEQKKYLIELSEKIKDIYNDSLTILEALQILFPIISQHSGKYLYNDITEDELRQQLRVACKSRFPYYFHLSLEEITISNELLMASFYEYSDEQIGLLFNELIKSGRLNEYVNDLKAYIDKIPNERLNMFLKPIIDAQAEDSIIDSKPPLKVSKFVCELCCWNIFKKIGPDETQTMLIKLLQTLSLSSFSILLGMISSIEENYGRLGRMKGYKYRIISEEQLLELDTVINDELIKHSQKSNLLNAYQFSNVFQLWQLTDKQICDNYMKQALVEPSNIPKFYTICTGHWSNSNGDSGWTFSNKYISEYITIDDAYERIYSLKGTREFSALTWEQKELAVAYHLWYHTDRGDRTQISKRDVDELIKEWETN